jgi:RimJ/RimL family protein N-acetyltransferase
MMPAPERMILRDNLCHLRKLTQTDFDLTWEWINRPEILLAMGLQGPISEESHRRWFGRLEGATDKVVFAICISQGDAHIGNLFLDQIDHRHRNARLAIFIADPMHRGLGIGSAAVRLLLDHAFTDMNLHRVYLKTTSGSDQLAAFYRKLGFTFEGRMREHEYLGGHYVDKDIFGILRSEWMPTSVVR